MRSRKQPQQRQAMKTVFLSTSKQSIWLEGFRAGQALQSQTPYADGTPEAQAWLQGCAQGLHADGHQPSGSEDTDFDDSELEDTGFGDPLLSRWRQLFKTLLGR